MCAYVDGQTRPTTSHNFKKSKLKKRTNIESLPDDVVFDILARVPAQYIHYAARLVCHKWYQTIRNLDFVRAQHNQSTCGLLIQHKNGSDQSNRPLLFATQKGQRIIDLSGFDYRGFVVFASCNGLMLERYEKEYEYEFRITNPVTNQQLDLPSVVPGTDTMGMAYAVASNKYKVVRSFHSNPREVECAILTVGVDEDWKRRVDIQHLSPTAKELLRQFPLTTQGFVHWAAPFCSGGYPEYVLTLNIETEVITQFPAFPPSLFCGCDDKTALLYCYLSMGSYLSLLIARDNKFRIWDQVWVMKPETGEWTKMMSIDSKSQKRALKGVPALLNCKLYPVGWLKFRQVLVFCDSNWWSDTKVCVAYNVRTHEIESFKLSFRPCFFFVHRNSLVWLDRC